MDESVEFLKPPHFEWTYTDLQLKCTYVTVAIPIFSGSHDINFKLHEDGMKLSISYNWAHELYIPEELLAHELNKVDGITTTHPMFHSLAMQLMVAGYSERSVPRGMSIIKLPVKVQREVGSWTKNAITTIRGNRIILLKFKAFQEDQIIKDADTSLIFK